MIQAEPPTKKLKDLKKDIKNQYWQNAKTYEDIAPHEYFIKQWNEPLFKKICECIKEYGTNEIFKLRNFKKKYRYFYVGEYRYWRGGVVLNRTKVKLIRYTDGVSFQKI